MLDPRLHTFIQVAKSKNLTRAAERLNLTQPAVTQHIKLLEEHYGIKLIDTRGRQTTLTEAGKLLYQYALDAEAKEAVFERKLRNHAALVKQYRIGATLTIGEYVLPAILGVHKRLRPTVDLVMQVHNTEGIIKKLRDGEIDFGIVEGPFDKSQYLHQKVGDDELVLAVPPESGFARREAVGMAEVLGGNLILREKGSGTRDVFEDKLAELGYNPSELNVYMEIGSIGAIKSLVEAGLGYTIISRAAISREVIAGSLVIAPLEGIRIMREFTAIYLKDGPREMIDELARLMTGPMNSLFSVPAVPDSRLK